MGKEKIYEDFTFLHRRVRSSLYLLAISFIFLVIGYWKVQILDHRHYWSLAEANRLREITIPAPRGCFYDRNGLVLADNIASYKACLIRENNPDWKKSLAKIAELLQLEETVLQSRIEKYANQPYFFPVVIKDNLSLEEVAQVEARRLEFPELSIEREPRRFYPFGSLTAHVVGYLQEISSAELNSGQFKGKVMGDLIGKTGLEKTYESWLTGEDGKKLEIVDSLGRSHGEYGRVEPKPGHDLHLALDFDLQAKAQSLLEGREGAIVALAPHTGEVLAMVSSPTFDPNKFVSRFSSKEWEELFSRPDHPLENRAIRGLYPPGSVFKLTVALAGLQKRIISPETTFFCPGEAEFYGRVFACWQRGGHGWVNLPEAIKNSCNIYFYNVGRRLGIEDLADFGRDLGFGAKTGIDLPGEKEGLVPDPKWKKETQGTEWFAGETISVSIGQGPIQVTPLQVAAHTALVANRGQRIRPHLVLDKMARVNREAEEMGLTEPKVEANYFEKVIEGMWRSVNDSGTGHLALVEGFDVCGKTGSTQVISREKAEKLGLVIKPHSWFTGFAPRNNPSIVVTVVVEFGGLGGASAAPLAREMFALYKEKLNHD